MNHTHRLLWACVLQGNVFKKPFPIIIVLFALILCRPTRAVEGAAAIASSDTSSSKINATGEAERSATDQNNVGWPHFKIKDIEDYMGVTNRHTTAVEQSPAVAREISGKKEPHTSNPHRDSTLCTCCHTSVGGGKTTLRFDGNVSQLCRSCHDGKLADSEAHPSELMPSAEIAKRIPSDLPLYDGMLTCLSCHDVVGRCKAEQTAANRNFLRGTQAPSGNLAFCFRCHAKENYQPFNVHDQLAAGKLKTDTCAWCHVNAPRVSPAIQESGLYALRSTSHGLCNSCHQIDLGHPANGAHINSIPLPDMLAYMYAYEIQSQMSLPLKQLAEYIRAMKKIPRSIPLDQNGGVTCYSCHNPHEKGVFPNSNLRAIGAEPKHAVNHRLRTHENNICKACHDKEITQ
ncbi:MAG: hypothetical protein Q7T18_12010 [Sedimentisphaerales bacterium]|nr:hypothetical protein [Sedimentisphaerales bacterium]